MAMLNLIQRAWSRVCAGRLLSAAGVSFATAAMLMAQSLPNPTKVLDGSALHPPAGASVAIVEWADLECPACAHANPLVKEAAAKYKIPWIRHDYVIQMHPWSKYAAIYARWFDAKGNGLGDAYRDAVFANQPSIYNVGVLTQFTQNFASSHGLSLPFAVDPQNKLRGGGPGRRRPGQSHRRSSHAYDFHCYELQGGAVPRSGEYRSRSLPDDRPGAGRQQTADCAVKPSGEEVSGCQVIESNMN